MERWIMKIKADFITNSSSTAFIIVVPSDLKLVQSFSELNTRMNDDMELHFNDSEEEAVAAVNQNLESLKSGNTLWIDDTEGFYTTKDFLEKKGFILKTIDMSGGDGTDIIEPITSEEIYKILNRMQTNEIKN